MDQLGPKLQKRDHLRKKHCVGTYMYSKNQNSITVSNNSNRLSDDVLYLKLHTCLFNKFRSLNFNES